MTTQTQSPPTIRFADGSQVYKSGRKEGWLALRRNRLPIMADRAAALFYPTADAAVAALAALGEGPAGEMKMREGM